MEDKESRTDDDGSNPPTSELRINLPSAASLAGMAPEDQPTAPPSYLPPATGSTPRIVGRSLEERLAMQPDEVEGRPSEPLTGSFALPDWSEPPTGLVPRVLLDESDVEGVEGDLVETGLRGPSWREDGSDWDNAADLAFLAEAEEEADEASLIAGQTEAPIEHPFSAGFDEINAVWDTETSTSRADQDVSFEELLDDTEDLPGATPAAAVPHVGALGGSTALDGIPRPRRRAHEASSREPAPRNLVVATLVGLAAGAVALICFHFGAPTSLALVTVIATVASAELFSSLLRAGYRPATLLGIVAVPVMIVGTYLHGPIAIPTVLVLLMLGFAIWGVTGLTAGAPIVNLGVTALVVGWTGVLGSFGGLLLNPASFPHRTGVAFVVGAVVLTVAHDVGSYAVGARFGRHVLAPRVSPGKTREGLIGGTLVTLIIAGGVVANIHPFNIAHAMELGVMVIVFAPLGDLFESVIKRDLGLKDMGRILPAHGGVFDRVDAMLFVLPACYFLIRLLGLA